MNPFTQRTYGILINKKQEVLISDEFRFGRYFRKFPGGGVEKGEGIIDALKREFKEELSRVIIHGFLHLAGYNDKNPEEKKIMRKLENQFLKLAT